FGRRHVPPAFITAHADVAIVADVNDGCSRDTAGLSQRGSEVIVGLTLDHVCAETASCHRKVHGQRLHRSGLISRKCAVSWIDIACSKTLLSKRATESADAVEAAVIHEDDGELQPLLDGGDDLIPQHEITPVADHDIDLASRLGHLDPQTAGDLVAHATVSVLEVELFRMARAPELVKIAGHAAGGVDHDRLRITDLIHRADQFALAGQRLMPDGMDAIDLRLPLPMPLLRLLAPGRGNSVTLKPASQLLHRDPGITHEREGQVLEGVKLRHVDVDETHLRRLEGGLAC